MKPKAGTFACSSVMHFCSGPTMQNHSGVDTWLADVLARLPDHPASQIDELLPWRWKAARVDAKTPAAAIAA